MIRNPYRLGRLVLAAALSLLALLAAAHAQDAPGRVPNLPGTPYAYANPPLPPHLAVIRTNIPKDNPITDHGATLGRVLFYDKRLSVTNTTACASCHFQEYAFSDPEQFSTGFAGVKTPRNAMGLANGRFFQADHFFWDARVSTLEELILIPIQSPIEMGSTLEQVVAELSATPLLPRRCSPRRSAPPKSLHSASPGRWRNSYAPWCPINPNTTWASPAAFAISPGRSTSGCNCSRIKRCAVRVAT